MRRVWNVNLLALAVVCVLGSPAAAQFDAPEVSSPDANNLFEQGLEFARNGDYDSAIAEFEKALMITSNFPSARYNLAFAYERKGDLARAEQEYKKTLELEPDHGKALHSLGVLMYKQNKFREAADYLRQATAADPKNLDAQFALGTAQHKCGNLTAARAAFEEALAIDSSYVDALFELGDVEYEIGERTGSLDEAIATYTRVVERFPKYEKTYIAYFNLGKIHSRLKESEKAAEMFGKSAELRPELPEAHFMQGKALAKAKSYDAAIKAFRRAAALKGPYGAAHYELARIYQTLQSYESALKEYRAAAADAGFDKRSAAQTAARSIQDYLDKLAEQQAAQDEEEDYDSVDDIPSSDFEP